jgi:hypothetical protein
MILKSHSLSSFRCWFSLESRSVNWLNSHRTRNWSINYYWSGDRIKSNNWRNRCVRSIHWSSRI